MTNQVKFMDKLILGKNNYEQKVPDYKEKKRRNPIRVCAHMYMYDIPDEFKEKFRTGFEPVLSRIFYLAPECADLIWNDIDVFMTKFFKHYNETDKWVQKCMLRYSAQYGDLFTRMEKQADYE